MRVELQWTYRALFLAVCMILGVVSPAAAGVSDPIDVVIAGAEDIAGVQDAKTQYPQYREQNIVVTNHGTVVMICQAQNKSDWSDRSGQDLIAKRSTDSGKTWQRATRIATHGTASICPNAAVYDAEADEIHVLYNLFTWDYRHPPVRGEVGDLNCTQHIITSGDDGQTWSKPRNISQMIDSHGAVMVVGSGEGIQLKRGPHSGRLILAGGDFYEGKKVLCFYSDDHGKIWQRSQVVPSRGEMSWASESKVAELPDGTLVLNSRTFVKDGAQRRLRTRAFSQDGGVTWSTLENDPALRTVSCNGSLIAVAHENGKDGAVLLCSVPVGPGRTHGTVYVSLDGGKTWPQNRMLVPGEFAYSSLIQLPDGQIGLFFESRGHRDIKLVRFTLDRLLDSQQ